MTRGPSDGADAGTSSPPEREDATFAGAATRALEAAAEVGLAVPDDDGVGVLVQSSSGVIEAATPQAAALLGLTLPQMLGRDSADRRWAAVDEDGKALRGQDHPSMRAVSSGMVVRDAVIGVHRPGHDPAGHHVWLAVDAVPYGPAGSPDRVVVRFSVITGPRATELRLAASERLYRFLVEYDPDIVAWQLPDTTFLWVSSAARTLLGHEPAAMIGRAAYEFMHPDDVPIARQTADSLAEHGAEPRSAVLRMQHRAGHYLWMEVTGQIVRDADGAPSQMRTAWRDVTARIAAEQERDAALQMVRSTIDSSPIGIAVCLADGSFTQVNRALCAMLSRDSADLIGRTLQQCAHPADYHDDITSVLSGDLAEHESECRFERGDGTWIWGHCNLVRLRDDGGHAPSVLVQLQDITERHRADEQLAHAASHDWLTGLANRKALTEHLSRAADQISPGTTSAMIFVDLDDFKAVNDTYGHEIGDRLLSEVASRLKTAVRRTDFAARLGGDEFVVHCASLDDHRDALAVATGIRDALHTPFVVDSKPIRISVSIGVTTATQTDPARLMARADRAMYRAKRRGRAGIEVESLP